MSRYQQWLKVWPVEKEKLENVMRTSPPLEGSFFYHWNRFSEREKETLYIIWKFMKETKECPSYQQIGDLMGLTKPHVQQLIRSLVQKEAFEKQREGGGMGIVYVPFGTARKRAERQIAEQAEKAVDVKAEIENAMEDVFGG